MLTKLRCKELILFQVLSEFQSSLWAFNTEKLSISNTLISKRTQRVFSHSTWKTYSLSTTLSLIKKWGLSSHILKVSSLLEYQAYHLFWYLTHSLIQETSQTCSVSITNSCKVSFKTHLHSQLTGWTTTQLATTLVCQQVTQVTLPTRLLNQLQHQFKMPQMDLIHLLHPRTIKLPTQMAHGYHQVTKMDGSHHSLRRVSKSSKFSLTQNKLLPNSLITLLELYSNNMVLMLLLLTLLKISSKTS